MRTSYKTLTNDEFNAACKLREEVAEKLRAPEGWETIFAFECGVLLPPEHEEFDFYANVNPELPFGFYDEDQEMFLYSSYEDKLKALKEYVLNGVEGTYGIISYQGQVAVGDTEHENLIKGEYDVDNISYTFFKNAHEIVWSGCKNDGKLVDCFLEKEILRLADKKPALDGQIQEARAEKSSKLSQSTRSNINFEL